MIGHKLCRENPQNFEEACVFGERILCLANLVGGGSTRGKFRRLDLPDYAPIDLDSMGAWEHCCQPAKGGG